VTSEFEFGGPLGAAAVMMSLPLVIIGLYVGCGSSGCASGPASAVQVFRNAQLPQLWDWTAAAVVFGWTALHFALYVLLPGPRVEGVVLRDGSRLKYPINGHLALWVSLTACLHGLPQLGLSLSWLYDHYIQLAIASCALSTLISVYCYAVSFAEGCMLADGGNSRNPVYDFFIGRPLNPRIGQLDLKACCELRPGLIGWAVLNLGMACKQWELTGAVSPSMLLVNACQLVYVWDALYNEQARLVFIRISNSAIAFLDAVLKPDTTWALPSTLVPWRPVCLDKLPHLYPLEVSLPRSTPVLCFPCSPPLRSLSLAQSILTTMDITTDGFGFMLAFGDLAWVPFTYSLQVREARLVARTQAPSSQLQAARGDSRVGCWLSNDVAFPTVLRSGSRIWAWDLSTPRTCTNGRTFTPCSIRFLHRSLRKCASRPE
jgi:hypothetical protein